MATICPAGSTACELPLPNPDESELPNAVAPELPYGVELEFVVARESDSFVCDPGDGVGIVCASACIANPVETRIAAANKLTRETP
jgi:hypothetical protein